MFQGAFVAIVTPFANGSVDEDGLRELIEFQIASGTHGIVPCGTTGESATLSHEEHERVIEITVDQVKGRVPVVAGTGSNNTAEAIRLTRHAKNCGADGALMIAPYYNKPTQEGLYQHFKTVAAAVAIPIIVYNIPGRSAVNIAPDTLARLSRIDNIIGVKEAAGSIKQVTEIITQCEPGFTVLAGEDYITFPLLCVGGKGGISVVSNVAPGDMANLCRLFFDGQMSAARELYYRLLPLCDAMFVETNPAPVKTALALMGKIKSAELRLPLVAMQPQNVDRLRQALSAYGIL